MEHRPQGRPFLRIPSWIAPHGGYASEETGVGIPVALHVHLVQQPVGSIDGPGHEHVRILHDEIDGRLTVVIGALGIRDDPGDVRLVHPDGIVPGKALLQITWCYPADDTPGGTDGDFGTSSY